MQRPIFTIVALLYLLLGLKMPASAQSDAPSEYDVKAAFLYNFTKFVQWPQDVLKSHDSLSICILGKNPFGTSLEAIVDGKSAYDKPIKIIYISDVGDIRDCQILFIVGTNKKQLAEALSAVTDMPVLTVSDFPEFVSNGGIIGFYLENKRVRFEINSRIAHNTGLEFSSRLLKLARLVQDEQ